MSSFEDIAGAAGSLRINHRQGKYHKPLVLAWMIRRAIDGRARLVSSDAAAREIDDVLTSISGASAQSAWPLLKLHTDLGVLWLVEGADPAGEPTETFTAGWNLSAFSLLSEDPERSEELIEQIIEQYMADVELGIRPLVGGGGSGSLSIEVVWERIVGLEGEVFLQVRGGEFTYSVRGNAISLDTRNRLVSRGQFAKALERWPVQGPGRFLDLQAPSYLYAILSDDRVLGRSSKRHWTRESYLDALPNDEERRLAGQLMDRVLKQGRIWYGVEGGGGLNLHYRQNCGPIALTLRGDGHAGMYGLWNTWNRSKNNPAYRPIAEFVDQSHEGPASSIRLVDLDFEDLWAAIGETAELLRGVAGVETIEPPESEPAES